MRLHDQQLLLQQYDFKRFIFETYPDFIYAPYLSEIITTLQKQMFITRKGLLHPRIILTVPPRHSKTSVMLRFLLWTLLNNPEWEVTIVSYSQTLADKASLAARNLIENNAYIKKTWPHITLSKERSSVKEWFIYNRGNLAGCYRAVGVGGSLTGSGFSCLICDDLFKNIEEADSLLMRDKIWDWYTSVAMTRQAPKNMIINCNTRWHLDDHIGRLLKLNANEWLTFKYPAFVNDKPLFPQRFTANQLLKLQSTMSPRLWQALYMQEPINASGNIIKQEHLQYFETLPEEPSMMIQSWDLRFSRSQAATSSFVVGQVWAKCNNCYYLTDQVRERIGFVDSKRAVIAMSNKYHKANIRLVEKKANGDALEDDLSLLGITLVEPRGDKIQRVERCYGLFVSKQVFIHESLRKDIEPELLSFPNGQNDDQCFVAGTKIKTLFGDKNIEDVKKGDYVLTPFGFSKVKKSCCTGIRPVVARHGLTGTCDHPIFCVKSFAFKNLIDSYEPLYLNLRSFLWLRLLLNLSGTARYISLSGVGDITSEVRQLMHQGKVYQCYTETFMNFIVAKKYLKAVSFIIKTAITLIMTLVIWSVCLLPSIKNYTEKKLGNILGLLGVKKILITLGRLLRYGISQKREDNGIKNTLSIQYRKEIQPPLQGFVSRVEKSTPQKNLQPIYQNSAQIIVGKNIDTNLVLNLRLSDVVYVERAQRLENLGELKKELHVEGTNAGAAFPVFNLTVEAGVYYANEILVHNCDSMSMALNWFQDNDSYSLECFSL